MLEKSRKFQINHALNNQEIMGLSENIIVLGKDNNKMTGTIKRVLAEKKFGFIRGENEKEYFVHASSCIGFDLNEMQIGKNVEFDEDDKGKGPRAERVRIQ